jgi:hypothetical protein
MFDGGFSVVAGSVHVYSTTENERKQLGRVIFSQWSCLPVGAKRQRSTNPSKGCGYVSYSIVYFDIEVTNMDLSYAYFCRNRLVADCSNAKA